MIKRYLVIIAYNIIKFGYCLVRKKKGLICIIDETPYSGSNAKAMYDYITNNTSHKDVFITSKFLGKGMNIKEMYKVASSHIFLCTHRSFKVSKKQVCIQFWHGIPLKRMNYMDKGESSIIAESWHKGFNVCDYVISSSDQYEILMSSCIGIPNRKFVKTGFPRNDFLFSKKEKCKSTILNLFPNEDLDGNTKIIMYLPTFRIGLRENKIEGKLRDGNIFGFDNYDLKMFDKVLKENNYVCIAKLHPMEERLISTEKFSKNNRIKLVNTQWLAENQEDLYNYLSISDMLITDYSSVYFDYLVLDKPMVFINSDLQEYRKNRGLLLEPYDFWTPGYKVQTEDELINAILAYSKHPFKYQKERVEIMKKLYEIDYKGNCQRIWEKIIEPLLL